MKIQILLLLLAVVAGNSLPSTNEDVVDDARWPYRDEAEDPEEQSNSEVKDFEEDVMDDNEVDGYSSAENAKADPRPLVWWCRRGKRRVCRHVWRCRKIFWKKVCGYRRVCHCECPAGTYFGCVWLWKGKCFKVIDARFCFGNKECKCRPRLKGDAVEDHGDFPIEESGPRERRELIA
ncbi:uncharacterized protein LOC135683675 isoform X3 [Rhopilema esculentum]|uniref:uncharacterized protein LOC135683675 isoform X3 n=1 Tax=Rhopilema esculentum TaxID=499914 RepID=UPI0031DA385F